MAGLFDSYDLPDLADVPEYSPGVPVGIYEVTVAHVETKEKDSGKFLVITYTVTEEDSEHRGKSHQEWKRIPDRSEAGRSEAEITRDAQYLKKTLTSLGVPPEKQGSITADDLQGIEGVLELEQQRNNPNYRQVKSFSLNHGGTVEGLPKASDEDSSNPYAGMLD